MTIAEAWEKAKVAYQWLGGHPLVAGLIIGFLAGAVVFK